MFLLIFFCCPLFLKGYDNLVVYAPERELFRQFGVSTTAVGLRPGQRREKVFSDDSGKLGGSPRSSSGKQIEIASISLPYRNLENSGDSDLELDLTSDDENGSLSDGSESDEKAVGSDEHRSEGSLNEGEDELKEEGEDVVRYQQNGKVAKGKIRGTKGKSRARIRGTSPISGKLIDDEEAEEEEVGDTELDDLLNDEIDMSCLDIDKEDNDSSFEGVGDDGEETYHLKGTNNNNEVGSIGSIQQTSDLRRTEMTSGRIEGTGISASPKKKGTGRDRDRDRSLHALARISESSNIPKPRVRNSITLTTNEKEQQSLSAPMVIETLRPFGTSTNPLLKKPLKRLNFVAAPGKTPEARRWHLDSRNSDSPDIFSDFGSFDRVKQVRGAFDDSPSVQQPIFPSLLDGAHPASSRKSLERLEAGSPLEDIYSKNSTSSTRYEFNPLVFPSAFPEGKKRLSIETIERANERVALAREVDAQYLKSNPDMPVVKVTTNSATFQSIASPYPSMTIPPPSAAMNISSAAKFSFDNSQQLKLKTAPPFVDPQLSSPSQILLLAQEGALHVMDYFSPSPRKRVSRRVMSGIFAKKAEGSIGNGNGNVINGDDDNVENGNNSLLRRAAVDDSLLGFTMRSVESKRGSGRRQPLSAGEGDLSDTSTNSSMNVSMKSVLSAPKTPNPGGGGSSVGWADTVQSLEGSGDYNEYKQQIIAGGVSKERELERDKEKWLYAERNGHRKAARRADPGLRDRSDHDLPKSVYDDQDSMAWGRGEKRNRMLSNSNYDHLLDSSDSEGDCTQNNADTKVTNSVFGIFADLMTSRTGGERGLSSAEELADKQIESEIDNFILPEELSPIIFQKYGIDIGVREVNGIRMNALRSLPALLSAIGKGSRAQPEGGMEELSCTDLGMWGDVSQSGDLSLSHITYSDPDPEDIVEAATVATKDSTSGIQTGQRDIIEDSAGSSKFNGLFINLLDVDDDINDINMVSDDSNEAAKVSDSIERLINMAAPTGDLGLTGDISSFDHDDDDFTFIPSPLSTCSNDTLPLFDNQNHKVEVEIDEDGEGEVENGTQRDILKVLLDSETQSRESNMAVIDAVSASATVFETISDDNRKYFTEERKNGSNLIERNSNIVVSIPAVSRSSTDSTDFDKLDSDLEEEFYSPFVPESIAHRMAPIPEEHSLTPSIPLTEEEAEELILYGEARLAWEALDAGTLLVNEAMATSLLQRSAADPESITEPLEKMLLLVDHLGADVNGKDENSMTPLHSLFSRPSLGRFILSRGGDVLAKDDNGDSVLAMCAEYGYNWIMPAFMSMHTREAQLLEDPLRAHEYAVILVSLYGYGVRAKEIIDEGLAKISPDEALEIMDTCKGKYENMKEPIETFELLQQLILS